MDAYIEQLPLRAADEAAAERARARWNAIAKPVGSLGLLEDAVVRIAALTGNEDVDVSHRCVVTLCADNGVTAQGISQSGAEVTRILARMAARGVSSACRMCEPLGARNVVVDMGMFERVDEPGLLDRRIAAGTHDIARGPAMTREQALQCIRTGVELVGELAQQGYSLIGTGEMGIGNTTTTTAMACAFLGAEPADMTGPGAGLPVEGVAHKASVIRRAIVVNEPNPSDPLDVLCKLGGFDIAGMCGLFLGGAMYGVPMVIDGVISAVAAYCAWRMRPQCRVAMLASHLSAEPVASTLLRQMDLSPVVCANMRLGEGTGTTCLMALLDLALSLYRTGPTFADCGITSYVVEPS